MKTWLQLEEIAEFLFSIFLFSRLSLAWWLYPLLFFTPDLSLIALTAGPRFGGFFYNLIHHKGFALALFVIGAYLALPPLSLAGAVLLGHTSLDRIFGFGLKEGGTFSHAHLKLFGAKQTQKEKAYQ